MFPVFQQSQDAMDVVGFIGGITAISAAITAVVMTDIKRVLAYSTISQLGYMMLALGTGAYVAAIFHLFTHAFFKALLFLGSGSVNHSTNTFDMRLMGGLRKTMPVTFWTFLIGTISLMGLFPFAGFWSKDEILSDAFKQEPYLFWLALIAAGLTAFYMTRVLILTFFGEYRGGAPESHEENPDEHATAGHGAAHHGPHESPWVMTLPLIILAVPAIIAGFANIDKDIEHLLVGALPEGVEVEESVFRWNVAISSTIVPLLGIALAYLIYQMKVIPSSALERAFKPLHTFIANRYYFDVLYEKVIVGMVFMKGIGGFLGEFDRLVVDGAVNGIGRGARGVGGQLKYLQSGQFQTYGAVGFAGLLVTAVVVLILNPV
jgi:NADH-quinone oxidoreductase subunit L